MSSGTTLFSEVKTDLCRLQHLGVFYLCRLCLIQDLRGVNPRVHQCFSSSDPFWFEVSLLRVWFCSSKKLSPACAQFNYSNRLLAAVAPQAGFPARVKKGVGANDYWMIRNSSVCCVCSLVVMLRFEY